MQHRAWLCLAMCFRCQVLSAREVRLAGSILHEGKALVLVANKVDALTPKARKQYVEVSDAVAPMRCSEYCDLAPVSVWAIYI